MNVFIGVMIGGLAGAATILLFAAQSANQARAKIRRQGIQWLDRAAEIAKQSPCASPECRRRENGREYDGSCFLRIFSASVPAAGGSLRISTRRPFHDRKETSCTSHRNIGMLLLAILLIAWGLVTLLGISGLGAILAILAIAAGIFILLNR